MQEFEIGTIYSWLNVELVKKMGENWKQLYACMEEKNVAWKHQRVLFRCEAYGQH